MANAFTVLYARLIRIFTGKILLPMGFKWPNPYATSPRFQMHFTGIKRKSNCYLSCDKYMMLVIPSPFNSFHNKNEKYLNMATTYIEFCQTQRTNGLVQANHMIIQTRYSGQVCVVDFPKELTATPILG